MLYVNYISIKLGEKRSIRIKGCKSKNYILPLNSCFPGGAVVKNSPANEGDSRDMDYIAGSERSPGGGHGNTLQYFCLENPMDRGAWRAASHMAAKSLTWLSRHVSALWALLFIFPKFISETLRRNISCFPRHFPEPQIFFCQSVLQFLSRFEPRVEQKHLTVFKKIYINLIMKLPPSSEKTVVVDKSSWYTFLFYLILCSYKFLSFCIWLRILTNFWNLYFGSWDELI